MLPYKWNKWGKYWVWEGNNLVAVGNKDMGYAVQEKGAVTIRKDRLISEHRGYYGTYKTRREALACLELVDGTIEKGGELVLEFSGGDLEEWKRGGAWSSYVPKTGAHIIVYHKDFPTDLVHELEHKRLGYLGKVTPSQEVEVVSKTISKLKDSGLYSPEERERTIDMLSGYIKRKDAKKKAEEIVSQMEAGEKPTIEGVSWKVRKSGELR